MNAPKRDVAIWAILGGLLLALPAGCDPTQMAERARNRQLQEHPGFELPSPVAKFSGRVTVDGKPPKRACRLFVILNDPKHLDQTAGGEAPSLYATCDADGKFGFSTYQPRDGVLPGKYVVSFVELHRPLGVPFRSVRTSPFRPGPERHRQPDELHNLYNDPDKNAKIEEFSLDLEPPGDAHYEFNLVTTGKRPVEKPGPNAVVGVADSS
jgi:hypothetical protein